MDWVVGIFIVVGLLFFWGVWIFGYRLPMAKEHQRQVKEQAARERRAQEETDAVSPTTRRDDGAPSSPPGSTAA